MTGFVTHWGILVTFLSTAFKSDYMAALRWQFIALNPGQHRPIFKSISWLGLMNLNSDTCHASRMPTRSFPSEIRNDGLNKISIVSQWLPTGSHFCYWLHDFLQSKRPLDIFFKRLVWIISEQDVSRQLDLAWVAMNKGQWGRGR